MDSAASINWATPASTVLFAGQQLHWTTQSDLHMTAAYTMSTVAAEAATLYAHEGGIQAFAGNGPVSLQAHTDALEILADQSVTIISVNDAIEIKASKKIVLQAGQASVTLDGGNITFACPGEFSVKGAQHVFDAGSAANARLRDLPHALVTPKLEPYSLRWSAISAVTGKAAPDVDIHAVRVTDSQPAYIGSTGQDGRTSRQRDEERPQEFSVLVGSGDWNVSLTTDEDPVVLENEDWMDQEAEE
jgi:type VI secretion system secreted protein VgrG